MNEQQNLAVELVQPKLEISKRVLNIWIVIDTSGSMADDRIAAANQAMRECTNELKNVARQMPGVEIRIRCIAFSSQARWHIGPDPVDISSVSWTDLTTGGSTATGAAIKLLADDVVPGKMPRRGVPPVMVLISDGGNTDGKAYDRAIEQLDKEPWGAKAVRLSIGIGGGFDRDQLAKFTNHPEVGVLEAKTAVDLINYILFATVTASIAASRIVSVPGMPQNNVILPSAPAPVSSSGNINLTVF